MSTSELLTAIGYPEPDLPRPLRPVASDSLYRAARMNKVGSLYVHSLHEADALDHLCEKWEDRRDFQHRVRRTLNRLPDVLPGDLTYAVVKSAYPWVDAKDVDLILFDDRLNETEAHLTDRGFEFCGRSPTSFDVADPETDIQLDVQSEFSLQRVVYFNKQAVEGGVEKRSPYGTAIPILESSQDLALIVIHSVTEQLYLLKEFYTAVSILESMSRNQFDHFLQTVSRTSIGPACRAFFTLTRELCEVVFERYPPYMEELVDLFGLAESEQRAFRETGYETPHRYTPRTGLETIAGKLRTARFRRTLVAQLPRLASPSTASHILSQIVTRRERDHYVHDTSDLAHSTGIDAQ